MSARLRNGGALRILNVVDEFTRVALGTHVDRSIGAGEVIVQLERLFSTHGKPALIRSDNGREFIAASVGAWLLEQGVKTAFIEKGSPQQNAFVERFNGNHALGEAQRRRVRHAHEARVVLAQWVDEYNRYRPHRGLGFKTPLQFADQVRKELARERSKGSA